VNLVGVRKRDGPEGVLSGLHPCQFDPNTPEPVKRRSTKDRTNTTPENIAIVAPGGALVWTGSHRPTMYLARLPQLIECSPAQEDGRLRMILGSGAGAFPGSCCLPGRPGTARRSPRHRGHHHHFAAEAATGFSIWKFVLSACRRRRPYPAVI
jgi:hypothetical protein